MLSRHTLETMLRQSFFDPRTRNVPRVAPVFKYCKARYRPVKKKRSCWTWIKIWDLAAGWGSNFRDAGTQILSPEGSVCQANKPLRHYVFRIPSLPVDFTTLTRNCLDQAWSQCCASHGHTPFVCSIGIAASCQHAWNCLSGGENMCWTIFLPVQVVTGVRNELPVGSLPEAEWSSGQWWRESSCLDVLCYNLMRVWLQGQVWPAHNSGLDQYDHCSSISVCSMAMRMHWYCNSYCTITQWSWSQVELLASAIQSLFAWFIFSSHQTQGPAWFAIARET